MKRQVFRVGTDGFNGAWYPCAAPSKRGIIAMLGDSAEDYMASCGAKWLNRQGIHVLAMSPEKKDYGHHRAPQYPAGALRQGHCVHESAGH